MNPLHLQPCLPEKSQQGSLGKKPQVGAVQDAAVAVFEDPEKQRHAAAYKSYVGYGEQELTLRPQKGNQMLENHQRLPQVLQHIAAEDHVKGSPRQERQGLQVSYQKLAVKGGSVLSLDGVLFDAEQLMPLGGKLPA